MITHSKQLDIFTDWSTDFNGISTRLGLFYAKTLGNHIHYTLIFTFLYRRFPKKIFFKFLF